MRLTILLLAMVLPVAAHAECLNLKEAKKRWPDQHLSWRGDHCYYADRTEDEKKKPEVAIVPVAAPVVAADPTPTPPSPSQTIYPLTPDQLIAYGRNRIPTWPPTEEPAMPLDEPIVIAPKPHKAPPELGMLGIAVFIVMLSLSLAGVFGLFSWRRR